MLNTRFVPSIVVFDTLSKPKFFLNISFRGGLVCTGPICGRTAGTGGITLAITEVPPDNKDDTNDNILIQGFSESETHIKIMNHLGEEVIKIKNKSIGIISELIDLTNLQNGVYLVKIKDGESQITKKVIKQ